MRSARFCLPQSIERWSRRSPGSESCVWRASLRRAATLAASARLGLRSAFANSVRAAPSPFSEPAAAIHTVRAPCAGTFTR